jgi:hypothetical protein
MNTKIDIKSATIGLVVGVLAALGVAATTGSGPSVGRYQLVSNVNNGGPGGSYSLLVDTVTGRTWSSYAPPVGRSDDDFFQTKSGTVETELGSAVGRYQLVSNANSGGPGGSYSLLVDSATGRVWSSYAQPTGSTDGDFFRPKSSGH